MDKETDYKMLIDNLSEPKSLYLNRKNLGDNDIKVLAQALANSQVTDLDLNYNQIGCDGVKYLAEVLISTPITSLSLNNNNISDEGMKYLSEVLKDTAITNLNLYENRISFEGAQHLGLVLNDSKVRSLHLDIYHTKDTVLSKCISHHYNNDIAKVELEFIDNRIDIEGATYLNNTFHDSGMAKVKLSSKTMTTDDVRHLAQAFKHIRICELEIPKNLFTQDRGPEYLIHIFKDSQINTLRLNNAKLGAHNMYRLAEFLQEIQIFNLDLHYNFIKDHGMQILAPALKNTDIMYINLSKNFIQSEGAKFLSEILQDSKLLTIGLCHNKIGPDGAKHLANGLSNSQVTYIHLHGNEIQYKGYKYLFNDVDNTNLSGINLHANNIEEGFNSYTDFKPEFVPRTTTPLATRICNAFKELVVVDETSNEFEFTVPKNDVHPSIDVDEYAFLIGTLNQNPKLKIHIYNMEWEKRSNFFTTEKIDNFVDQISNKFNAFINDSNKIHDLINAFANHNFVNLVKKFEETNLHDIVQNLLLHRILYYVDENEEILHPYIYKLLRKYDLPLYNEQIEPNKREKIISYYKIHQEFDGAQEIMSVLQANDLP